MEIQENENIPEGTIILDSGALRDIKVEEVGNGIYKVMSYWDMRKLAAIVNIGEHSE